MPEATPMFGAIADMNVPNEHPVKEQSKTRLTATKYFSKSLLNPAILKSIFQK